MRPQTSTLPMLAVASSAILWGLWWIPLRWLDQGGLRGDWASFAIFGLASLVLLPFVSRPGRWTSKQIKPLLAIGVPLGIALVMWNHAVIHGNVIRVVLLFYLSPIWATLMARAMLGSPIHPTRWVAILLGLGGAAVIFELDLLTADTMTAAYSTADLMALMSGVCFAFSATQTRIHTSVREVDKTFVSVLAASGIALVFILFAEAAPPIAGAASLLAVAAGVALFFLLPAMALLLWGAGLLDPGRVAMLLLLEVLAAAISSALLTLEPLGLRQLLGCCLILAAGVLESAPGLRRART